MGKKKFIDKKNAVKFQLVHRSQNDPLFEDNATTQYVLKPLPPSNLRNKENPHERIRFQGPEFEYITPEDTLSEATRLRRAGIEDDYEYDDDDLLDQLVAEGLEEDGESGDDDNDDGSGEGQFSDADENDEKPSGSRAAGKPRVVTLASRPKAANSDFGFPEDGYDYLKHLKPIGAGHFIPSDDPALTARTAPASFFTLKADVPEVKEPEPEPFPKVGKYVDPNIDPEILAALDSDEDDDLEPGEKDEGLWDNFVQLANQRGGDSEGESDSEGEYTDSDGEYDDDDDADEDYDGTAYAHSRISKTAESIAPEDLTVYEERFEKIAAEYDDELLGAMVDEDEDEIGGEATLDQFDDLIEEFTRQKLYDINVDTPPEDDVRARTREYAIQAVENDAIPEDDPESDPEPRDKWDAETIVTTYSNIENHPALIGVTSKRKIKLSNKDGFAVDYLPAKLKSHTIEEEPSEGPEGPEGGEYLDEDGSGSDATRMTITGPRPKDESAEEKRARKKAVKEDRKGRREQKKEMKLAFKNEETKQKHIHRPGQFKVTAHF
eukprot:TRINITY_DN2374_c0_g1::TRINITY_DN2374_c0_g1_i1::g.20827::m.20827 TRINITY_DN2374_c0_g1::TRINITY_DN2374_c0_g1_i1::g.20827  ORF type:complete len:550 (+),score=182.49,sp/Q6NSQ7/LTV1_MOUSE/31.52/2e-31,LTV/PF04180.9/1.2e-08,LTV/PF04180.9/1.4e+04,LTV/PF04180.9/2.6e+02,LTV/PF04180.9/0.054 TRINITY_DN2374_c0_g1_i1:99-1748(+)